MDVTKKTSSSTFNILDFFYFAIFSFFNYLNIFFIDPNYQKKNTNRSIFPKFSAIIKTDKINSCKLEFYGPGRELTKYLKKNFDNLIKNFTSP